MDDELVTQLKRHEGYRSKAYQCAAGKTTIGYGRNLDDVGISKSIAEQLLMQDILTAETELFRQYPAYRLLERTRRDVLTNMVFNLGITRFSKFKNMHVSLARGNFIDAANHMLDSKWAKQVGARADELAEQMATGRCPYDT